MFPIYIVNPISTRYSPLEQGDDPEIPATWRTITITDPRFSIEISTRYGVLREKLTLIREAPEYSPLVLFS